VTVSGVTVRDRARDRLTCGFVSGVSRRVRGVHVTAKKGCVTVSVLVIPTPLAGSRSNDPAR
jgi:hypothetical protein